MSADAAATADANAERRLHPSSWVFSLWTEVRKFAVPVILLVAAARFTFLDLFWLPFIMPVVGYALVRQLTLRYALHDTELIVRRSLLVYRSERHIPFTRIHNLKIIETPLHRLLHVVEVVIETASGKEPEATLRVLSREAFDELRAHVAARTEMIASFDAREDSRGASIGSATDDDEASGRGGEAARGRAGGTAEALRETGRRVVLSLSLWDAAKYGALDNRGLVVVGALFGFGWEAWTSYQGGQPWEPRSWMAPWQMMRDMWRWVTNTPALVQSPVTWVLMAIAALAVLKACSIVWAVLTLHGFRVERARTSLNVTHGLLTRASTVIPLHRIQQIRLRAKPLHRLFSHVEVELDTVGAKGEGQQRQPVWLAPLAQRGAVSRLLAEVGAPVAIEEVRWEPVHPRAARRMRKKALLVVLAAGLIASVVTRRPMMLGAAAVVLPIALWGATMSARRLAYAVASPFILFRHGWIWQTIQITWVDRVQALAISSSPFDRRHGMATLIVDTAAGGAMGAGAALQVPYLGADTARALQDRLAAEVAATRFQW
jgi:putative membrane protein